MWFVAVTLIQILQEGIIFLLAEAGTAEQTEIQNEKKAFEHSGIPE